MKPRKTELRRDYRKKQNKEIKRKKISKKYWDSMKNSRSNNLN